LDIEIITSLPKRFIAGKPLQDGRVVFRDGEIEPEELKVYEQNPKFIVRPLQDGKSPEGVLSALSELEQETGVDLANVMSLLLETLETGSEADSDSSPSINEVAKALVELDMLKTRPKVRDFNEASGLNVSGRVLAIAWKKARAEAHD